VNASKISEKDKALGRNYDRAAWFYEKSAKIYSTNQIRASKRFQMKHLEPGQKILYLGAGAGEDAIMAARHGAHVTCIDISQGMLDQVQKKFDADGLEAELICVNAYDHERFGHYDVVAANYFLNVFRRDDMAKMLNHTAKFVREGGKYLIADVSTAVGNPLAKAFNILYLKMAMGSFWLMGLVPWHENYDYPAFFADAGLTHEHTEYFRFAKKGPILFQSIVARRSGNE
jgi:demethylmenaquinone methyltransferase/2-methoxy-6-polyprenyl-1,4-benzoquinol methylase